MQININFNFLPFALLDPSFRSDADLHLSANSPCIDAGNPAPEFRDTDNSRNDQGAFGGLLGDW
ncbi:MAG: hypothetical protein ACM3S2_01880 [Ignavibacteriales bacterium]